MTKDGQPFEPFEVFEPCDAVEYPPPENFEPIAFSMFDDDEDEPGFYKQDHYAAHWDLQVREVEPGGPRRVFCHHKKTHVVFQIMSPEQDEYIPADLKAWYVYSCGNRPAPTHEELKLLAQDALLAHYMQFIREPDTDR